MNSLHIREKFLSFFKERSSTIVPSSPLIPAEDPTLLFTNAGMNQFKDVFLGKERRSYVRAASIQKCVRAGGKHNDLDQVGFTKRHLTFFEMMGNFSFGDYFKKDAIVFAWDFLTKEMQFDATKLYITIYKTDDEAFEIWNSIVGLPSEKITRLGESDNFWQMGETGPCGPCSEIYVDRGPHEGCGRANCAPGCDCARYTEIWNLVFMQYDRQTDGTLIPLKQTGVDTGMGLERLCMIAQNVDSVFATDLFTSLHKAIEKITSVSYDSASPELKAAFHVLSDHIRSSCLIIADGGTPSNEGRGYVLRKIIRRAALFAQKISSHNDLFVRLGEHFISSFSSIYPELETNRTLIVKLLSNEVDKFSYNLTLGKNIFEEYVRENKKAARTTLSGAAVFKLYDTYGFPLELTRVLANEQGMNIDLSGFENEMKKQQEQSGKKSAQTAVELIIPESISSTFVGYDTMEVQTSILFVKFEDDHAWIVTKESPFYVESGGQVNDAGFLKIAHRSYPVIDLKKIVPGPDQYALALKIDLEGSSKLDRDTITVGTAVHCIVDAYKRMNTVRNHTATHLLQAALMQTLGRGVKQAGSVVNERYLRFDFTYHEPLSPEQLIHVENLINHKIQEDIKTHIFQTTLQKAQSAGIISFFGEKYNPEKVRVVEVPGFSAELCGGTHAPSTGIIGCFKIISEVALSSGVRRIVAVTGPEALRIFQENFALVEQLSFLYKAKPQTILLAIEKQQENLQAALREIKKLKKELWRNNLEDWKQQIKKIENIPFLYLEVYDLENDDLKSICKELEAFTPGFYLLISRNSSQAQTVHFLGYLSDSLKSVINLRAFAALLKNNYNMRGGGSETLIQGGGTLDGSLETALIEWLKSSKK